MYGMFMKFPSRTARPLKYLFFASKRIVQWHIRGPNIHNCIYNDFQIIIDYKKLTPSLFLVYGLRSASLGLCSHQGRAA